MSVVCIAGMHRSGTSMVSRLLNLCGLHLGGAEDMHPAAADNPEGYWEHAGFVELNERILDLSGTSWGLHAPLPDDWLDNPTLSRLVPRAEELLAGLRRDDVMWGWKDPRNSLTSPFWEQAVDEQLLVVHCLRHPTDVAGSLAARDQHIPDDVWFEYNDALLRNVPAERRIVTHYDAYFHDAPAELRRVVDFLGASVSDADIATACETVRTSLRHNASRRLLGTCVPAAAGLYVDLCRDAGPVFAAAHGGDIEEQIADEAPVGELLEVARDAQRRRSGLARQFQVDVEARRRGLVAALDRVDEQDRTIERLDAELQEHVRLVDELRGELLAVGEEQERVRQQADAALQELGAIKASRGYRVLARIKRNGVTP